MTIDVKGVIDGALLKAFAELGVWALVWTGAPDTYDVGEHEEVLQLFARQELAEDVAEHLIGKTLPGAHTRMSEGDLEVRRMDVAT